MVIIGGIKLKEAVVKVTENRNLTEYENEKNIKNKAKEIIRKRYNNCSFIDSICKVLNYNNYYVTRLCSYDFGIICFVFDKCGNVVADSGEVVVVNDENFFVINQAKNKNESLASHYQVIENKITKVYEMVGVYAVNEGYQYYKINNNLVRIHECDKNGILKKHLYDCRSKEFVIVDYDSLNYDMGNFFKFYNISNYDGLRVVKKVYYYIDDSLSGNMNLEFLIDEKGQIDDMGVCNFEGNKRYELIGRSGTQIDILNAICYEAYEDCVIDKKRKKLLKK